jgi:hypothetical protein
MVPDDIVSEVFEHLLLVYRETEVEVRGIRINVWPFASLGASFPSSHVSLF